MSTLNTSPHGNSFPRRGEEEEEEEREYAENCTGADTDDLYYVGRTPFRTGVLYIIYIDSFLFFFLSSFFPSFLFSFHAATTIFAHPAPPSRLLYTHLRAYQTYANACKSEYAHWRNGAINKDTTFLERSPGSFNSPPSFRIGFQRLPPICTFPAPPTIIDDDNNNIIQSLARRIPRIRMEMSASKKS